jgi:hypothetical protein
MEKLIKTFEKSLEFYKIELNKKPDSIFYKGLVKQTKKYIKKLKSEKN